MNAHYPSIHSCDLPGGLLGFQIASTMKRGDSPLKVRTAFSFTYLRRRILQSESYDPKKNYSLDLTSRFREGTFLANVTDFPSYAYSPVSHWKSLKHIKYPSYVYSCDFNLVVLSDSISFKSIVSFLCQQIPRDIITALMCFHLRSSCYVYLFSWQFYPFQLLAYQFLDGLAGILKCFVFVFNILK